MEFVGVDGSGLLVEETADFVDGERDQFLSGMSPIAVFQLLVFRLAGGYPLPRSQKGEKRMPRRGVAPAPGPGPGPGPGPLGPGRGKAPLIACRFMRGSWTKREMRAVCRRSVDRGESQVSYLAVVVLVASITGMVLTAGIGDTISGGIGRAVCQIIGGDCRADPTPGAAGAPSSPTQSTPPTSSGFPPGTGPAASAEALLLTHAVQAAEARLHLTNPDIAHMKKDEYIKASLDNATAQGEVSVRIYKQMRDAGQLKDISPTVAAFLDQAVQAHDAGPTSFRQYIEAQNGARDKKNWCFVHSDPDATSACIAAS